MLDAKDSLLQLTVNNNTVGDHKHRIKNILVLRVMNCRKDMSKPRNGLSLTASGRMLNKVIAGCMIQDHITHNAFNSSQLMETRENQLLGLLHFSGIRIPLLFLLDEDKPLDKKENPILFPNLLPHIGDIDAGIIMRITLTEVFSDIKRIEKGACSIKPRCVVNLIQIHCEAGKRTQHRLVFIG